MKQPHPRFPDRWADGTLRSGYPGPAVRHGARSKLLQARQAPRRRTLRAQVLRDLVAKAQTPPPMLSELVDALVAACQQRRDYEHYLAAVGTVTVRGARRAAALHHDESAGLIVRLIEAIRAEADRLPKPKPSWMPQ